MIQPEVRFGCHPLQCLHAGQVLGLTDEIGQVAFRIIGTKF